MDLKVVLIVLLFAILSSQGLVSSTKQSVFYITPTSYYNFSSLTNNTDYVATVYSYENSILYFNFWTDNIEYCDRSGQGFKTQTCQYKRGNNVYYQLGDPNTVQVLVNDDFDNVTLRYTIPPNTPCPQPEQCINNRSIDWIILCDPNVTVVQNVYCYEARLKYFECSFWHSAGCLINVTSPEPNNTTPCQEYKNCYGNGRCFDGSCLCAYPFIGQYCNETLIPKKCSNVNDGIVEISTVGEDKLIYTGDGRSYNLTSLTNRDRDHIAYMSIYENVFQSLKLYYSFFTPPLNVCNPDGLDISPQSCLSRTYNGIEYFYQLGDTNALDIYRFNKTTVSLIYHLPFHTPCGAGGACQYNRNSVRWNLFCEPPESLHYAYPTPINDLPDYSIDLNHYSFNFSFAHQSACLVDLPGPRSIKSPTIFYQTDYTGYNFTSLSHQEFPPLIQPMYWYGSRYLIYYNFFKDTNMCTGLNETTQFCMVLDTITNYGKPNDTIAVVWNETLYLQTYMPPSKRFVWKISCDPLIIIVDNVDCMQLDGNTYQCSFSHSAGCAVGNVSTASCAVDTSLSSVASLLTISTTFTTLFIAFTIIKQLLIL